jgi:hypothetical protein
MIDSASPSAVLLALTESPSFFTAMQRQQSELDIRALSVAQRRGKPLHDQLNNHWVTATGIIDAKAHGLWGFPCKLLLEEAHALRHQ